MIVIRHVYCVKLTANMQDVLAVIKEFTQTIPVLQRYHPRFLSDVSEPASSFVLEWEAADLAEYEKVLAEEVAHPQFPQLWARMAALIESFRIEFYSVLGSTAP